MMKDTVSDKMFEIFLKNKDQFTRDQIFWMIQNNYFGEKNTRKLKELYMLTYFSEAISNK